MKRLQILVPALVVTLAGCSQPDAPAAPAPVAQDGLTLTTATAERMRGSFVDQKGRTLTFDAAKVRDELYFDLRGADGLQIIHIDTTRDSYEFSYMNGKLKLHANKELVARARAEEPSADNSSTDGFVFEGDMNVLDAMMQLPEVAALPHLSRALGARGFTGRDFPATMALHKIAKQSAKGLGIEVDPIQVQASSQEGYCTAYPNRSNSCYGMCGNGCSCWSWVCGDCCYHGGCAQHDNWCRQGKWYYCYNITAVIALFGC
jgi:hypothetical protein